MKIKEIDRSRLRNDEHFQFHTEFRDLVVKEGAQKLNVQAQFDAYLPLYNKEDEGIKKVARSALTAKIHEADKARDETYTGMVELNAVTLGYHYSEAVRDAAKTLKVLFNTYGDLTHKPLNEQTSAIHNILQELKGHYLQATQAVRIDDWVNELEARNNAFDALVKERFDESASKSDVVVKTARANVDNAYNVIVERVSAFALIQGVEQYELFIKTLNSVIAKYSAIVNARLGRKHHKPETEETVGDDGNRPSG